jgi:tetratricopeptide (TPR) repeat protein
MIGSRLAHATALAIAALLLVIARPAPSRADDPATVAAKRHFAKAEKLFALGRFDTALVEYEAAFDAKPLPGFLFNIGQCHRNLHDYEAAVFSFRKYLRLLPDADNRDDVEELIRDLEAKQAAERDRAPLDQPPPPPRKHQPLYKKWWLWTGVTAIAGGITLVLVTRDRGVPATDLGNVVFP